MGYLRNAFAVVAVTCLLLWVSSYWLVFGASMPLGSSRDSSIDVSALFGRIRLHISHGSWVPAQWSAGVSHTQPYREATDMAQSVGIPMPDKPPMFSWERFSFPPHPPRFLTTWSGTNITFPLWLPVLLFGPWPVVATARHVRRRYFSPGVCRACGYDLRGSPSGVCPECGAGGRAAIKG